MEDANVPTSGKAAATEAEPKAPYVPQDIQEVAALYRALEGSAGKKKGGHCKRSIFRVDSSPNGITVESWRFQEWDYKRRDLPIYARGLFTTKTRAGHREIVVRGYDKFFNVDEVHATKWENIKKNTKGPYELTIKENGCIIFMSGLEDDTLLVCSKHSTGDRADVEVSHASAGERWVEKQLAGIGKTKADLARELRRRNVTAVAELCDDAFEEHILAYTPDIAGLYLHGINLNVPEFVTYPSSLVQKFADEWGFRKVGVIMMDNIDEVKSFLENVAETGSHGGRDVEGFVIRCRMSPQPGSMPYQDWFFKYKFEEPYLMYRQWRECTKAMIAGRQPKYNKHVKITEEYLLFARKQLAANPKLAKEYNQNHGIIKLRNDFLASKNLKGSDAAAMEADFASDDKKLVTQDVVLVPIGTIGCGKTTLAVALVKLFGWGHIQNDNIQGKGRPARFVRAVLDQLREGYPVVIADRNNAERREREQMIKDTNTGNVNARLVALNFVHSPETLEDIRRVTRERVIARGDNHQTIQAASDRNKFVGVMENFLDRFQPCEAFSPPDDGFDAVIDLDPVASSRENLEKIVTELGRLYPRLLPEPLPSAEQLDDAIRFALEEYTPSLRHIIPDRGGPRTKDKANNRGGGQGTPEANNAGEASGSTAGQRKKKPLEYMAIDLPTKPVLEALEAVFKNADPATARFFRQLQQTRRVQPRFHVTLIHRVAATSENPAHRELYERYSRLQARAAEEGWSDNLKLGEVRVLLERAVWDDRIMALVVRLDEEGLPQKAAEADEGEGDQQQPSGNGEQQQPKKRWACANRVPHITVGTRDDSVKPKESNDLLARWLDHGLGPNMGEVVFEAKPEIVGDVRGVMSR